VVVQQVSRALSATVCVALGRAHEVPSAASSTRLNHAIFDNAFVASSTIPLTSLSRFPPAAGAATLGQGPLVGSNSPRAG
jgi:hypothetical protein